jgi:arsenic resistance protein ArsH
LLLHGSLRARSYPRLLADEAERLLVAAGCETRRCDSAGLPLPDGADPWHRRSPTGARCRPWSEGQVWSSSERHGTLSGVMKCRIDRLPLEEGGVRPTLGRPLAVMQVLGGSRFGWTIVRLIGRSDPGRLSLAFTARLDLPAGPVADPAEQAEPGSGRRRRRPLAQESI